MRRDIIHVRHAGLLVKASQMIFVIHSLRAEISICNEELLSCLEDPLMLNEQLALKKQIQDHQHEMEMLRSEVNQYREQALALRQLVEF